MMKPSVLIVTTSCDPGTMFSDRGIDISYVTSLKELDDITALEYFVETAPDFVCFTGGADINPAVYGEEPDGAYGWNDTRDELELAVYEKYVNRSVLLGICRGGQLLNVLNGGKMIQDMHDGHSGDRVVKIGPHEYVLMEDHHQGMISGSGGQILATDDEDGNQEIIWYEKTRSFCFQAHPEWDPETEDVFFDLLEGLVKW